ncbi:Heat Shock Transcription Factor, HSF [Chondrus crispus]|uniref:Heat Shock Transcription Factor, HSF n=1 Tax=Chondrus crispus TaxID=2769 RepID=R7Q9G0_CHOCR|nr:Heat Shock Transcription Factor, HSF [Chondrus crispus]CDF34110.1 Heat Shock Transcription Factor, HSF [Chondrus crispus]|eukprot:XP_005713930.1 Heat Shock Transcription Factor, HSF [Chondrus crispus]
MSSSSGPAQPPPFPTKLFQLVNDASIDELVSWTDDAGRSFTVHKPSEFGRDILPKFFKHNNFSSFVRQLNQYGFHKQDPDRWMFGHEKFRCGRPDLLRDITRRRPKSQAASQASQAVVAPGTLAHKAVVELGNYGIEGEVKALKRDKDLLIRELVVTRQAEEKLKNKCDNLENRMEDLESNSKQMQAFIMHYFSQVLQPYSEAMASRKRKRIMSSSEAEMTDVVTEANSPPRSTSQPVSHAPQPPPGMDALRAMMQQMQMNMSRSPSTPRVRSSQPGPSPSLLKSSEEPSSPAKLAFAPATVQELHEELPPISPAANPAVHNLLSPYSSARIKGGISVREPGDSSMSIHDEALGLLEELPSTPNSSLTMDAIESALNNSADKPNGHLDTPDFCGKGFDDVNGEVSAATNVNTGCDRDEKAIEDFLDLDSDGAPLPPPLSHLPEGTDIHALAERIEGFQERTQNL